MEVATTRADKRALESSEIALRYSLVVGDGVDTGVGTGGSRGIGSSVGWSDDERVEK